MQLDLLKTFLAVAKQRSISKACEELYLTQPAVTKQIKSLESFYERQLFDRDQKRLMLTDEGKILYEYAERLLSLMEESRISVKGKEEEVSGKLNIASNFTLGVYIIPKILKFFRDVYPGVQIEVFLGNTERIAKAIKARESHFGFIGIYLDEPQVALHSFYRDKLTVVIGGGYKLKKKALRWQELLAIPFIGRERGSDIRTTYEDWFRQKGIKVKPAIELNSTEAIKSTVQSGLGFSILPWCTVEQDIHLGLLRALSLPYFNVVQDFYICHFINRTFSRVEKVFLEAIFNRLSFGPPQFPDSFKDLFIK